jgi:hypothetical protein
VFTDYNDPTKFPAEMWDPEDLNLRHRLMLCAVSIPSVRARPGSLLAAFYAWLGGATSPLEPSEPDEIPDRDP